MKIVVTFQTNWQLQSQRQVLAQSHSSAFCLGCLPLHWHDYQQPHLRFLGWHCHGMRRHEFDTRRFTRWHFETALVEPRWSLLWLLLLLGQLDVACAPRLRSSLLHWRQSPRPRPQQLQGLSSKASGRTPQVVLQVAALVRVASVAFVPKSARGAGDSVHHVADS